MCCLTLKNQVILIPAAANGSNRIALECSIGLTVGPVPSLFRQSVETNENQPSLMNVEFAASAARFKQVP
jgi:hypothetical protein